MRAILISGAMAMLATAAMAQGAGSTSGPAANTPTTLGTSGQTTATPHMKSALQKGGGPAMKSEHAGAGAGTKPQAGVDNAESGPVTATGK